MKRTEFAPAEIHLAALRHEQALTRELLLDAHSTRGSGGAHRSRPVEAHRYVSRSLTDSHRSNHNQWGIDCQRDAGYELGMYAPIIQCQRNGPAGLEYGKVGRSTNGDVAAFDQVEFRLSRTHCNVAAA